MPTLSSYLSRGADVFQRQVAQSRAHAVGQPCAPVGGRRRRCGRAAASSSSFLRLVVARRRRWPEARRDAEQQQSKHGARRGLRAVEGVEPVEALASGVRRRREPLLEHALRQVGRVDAGGARGDCQSVGER